MLEGMGEGKEQSKARRLLGGMELRRERVEEKRRGGAADDEEMDDEEEDEVVVVDGGQGAEVEGDA